MSTVTKIRHSDSPFHDPIQSERFVKLKCNWFFFTREKGLLGPYVSKTSAETALDVYLTALGEQRLAQQNTIAKYSVEMVGENVIPWKQFS